jgi:aerobic-type carbon monoxide dehydrogenase small subunit (CoxS/CutS family)
MRTSSCAAWTSHRYVTSGLCDEFEVVQLTAWVMQQPAPCRDDCRKAPAPQLRSADELDAYESMLDKPLRNLHVTQAHATVRTHVLHVCCMCAAYVLNHAMPRGVACAT